MFHIVLYCTLLLSSQSASEKAKIEEKMRNDPELAWILKALSETDRSDTAQVSSFLFEFNKKKLLSMYRMIGTVVHRLKNVAVTTMTMKTQWKRKVPK